MKFLAICPSPESLTLSLPVMTSRPAVADNFVSPVNLKYQSHPYSLIVSPVHTNRCLCLGFFQYDCHLCLVRHLYVLNPSSAETFLIWSSPLGKTTYFPSGGGRRLDQALRFDIYVDVAEDCLVLVT